MAVLSNALVVDQLWVYWLRVPKILESSVCIVITFEPHQQHPNESYPRPRLGEIRRAE